MNTKIRLKFVKKRCCINCEAMGISIICEARKYIAFTGQETQVFHVGYHACMAKHMDVRPTKLVCKSIAVDSSIASSKIHWSAIRKKKSLVEVAKVRKSHQ